MAALVHLTVTDPRTRKIATALQSIRDGLSVIKELDGLRAQTISVSKAKFGSVFGVVDDKEAQTFSDRLSAVAAGNNAGLNDLLDATIADK